MTVIGVIGVVDVAKQSHRGRPYSAFYLKSVVHVIPRADPFA